jgi:hypothetical protein
VPLIADPAAREEVRATLVRHGWSEGSDAPRERALRLVARAARARLARIVRAIGLHSDRLTGVPFASEAEALQAAVATPGPRVRKCAVMIRLGARELARE